MVQYCTVVKPRRTRRVPALAIGSAPGALRIAVHRHRISPLRKHNRANPPAHRLTTNPASPSEMLPWRQRASFPNTSSHVAHRRLPPPRRSPSNSPVMQPRTKRGGLSYSRSSGGGGNDAFATRTNAPRSPTPPAPSARIPSAPSVEAKRTSTHHRRNKLRRHSTSPVRGTTILRRMLRRQSTSPQPRKRDTMRRFLRRRSTSPIPSFQRRHRSNSPVERTRRRRSHSPLLRRLRRTRITLIRAANAHPVTRIMKSHPLTRSYIEEAAPGITRETRANTERNAAAPPRGTRKPYKRKAPPKVVSRAELRFKKELMFADEGSLCGDGRREHVPIHFGARDHRPRRITAPPPPFLSSRSYQ